MMSGDGESSASANRKEKKEKKKKSKQDKGATLEVARGNWTRELVVREIPVGVKE